MSTANTDDFDLRSQEFGGLVNEDVMQQIWDISKIPLAFLDRIGSDRATNHFTEWTIDELSQPDLQNSNVDGEDAGPDDSVLGDRVGNFTQLLDKVVRVSMRARAVDTIGFADTLAYQVMRRQQEIRRDLNAIMLENQASIADDGNAQPGLLGGLPSWLTSNTSRGVGGADGGFASGIVAAPTVGEARGLTETLFRDLAQSIWEGGGNPTVAHSTPAMIRQFSEYGFTETARIARLQRNEQQDRGPATAVASINLWLTDFDVTLELVADRLQQVYDSADVGPIDVVNLFMYDTEFLMEGTLQGVQVVELATTGTAQNRQMINDTTLKVLNEAAHGVIADLDPTVDVTQA